MSVSVGLHQVQPMVDDGIRLACHRQTVAEVIAVPLVCRVKFIGSLHEGIVGCHVVHILMYHCFEVVVFGFATVGKAGLRLFFCMNRQTKQVGADDCCYFYQ